MTLHSLTETRSFEEAFRDVSKDPDWNRKPPATRERITREAALRAKQRENEQ